MNHVTLIWIFAGGVSRKSRNVSDRHRRACLWLVFQHLNPIELCGLARVCREWREISEHPSLWKQVTLEDIRVNNMVSRNQVAKVIFLRAKVYWLYSGTPPYGQPYIKRTVFSTIVSIDDRLWYKLFTVSSTLVVLILRSFLCIYRITKSKDVRRGSRRT